MDEQLEARIGSVLNNPELMQKIMSIAQSMNSTPPQKEEASTQEPDLAMLQRLGGLAQKSGIDPQQKALLSALSPYLSRARLTKLENAMRAAKMAQLASGILGSGAFRQISGR